MQEALLTADILTCHSRMSTGVANNIDNGPVIQVAQCDSEPACIIFIFLKVTFFNECI